MHVSFLNIRKIHLGQENMNHHCIDYMIRERRREELEECERRRLLKSVCPSQTGLIRRAGTIISAAVRPAAWLPACVSTLQSSFQAKGGRGEVA